MSNLTVSSAIDTFMGSANQAAMRTNAGLVIGTNVQAYAAELTKVGVKGTDIASAGTTSDIGASTGQVLDVTGTTTITAFPSATAGILRITRFTGILILTHNGTSFQLPGAANITTAAGDVALWESLGSGNWKCAVYQRASGKAVIPPAYSEVTGTPPAVATPHVYHVTSAGNDGTGDGSLSAPFLTGTAAYNAGVTAGAFFMIRFGTGSFSINLSANWNGLCQTIEGEGVATSVAINASPAVSTNADGTAAYNVSVEVLDMQCTVNTTGGNVTVDDGFNHVGGVAGNVTLTGRAVISVNASGGGESGSSSSGQVTGAGGGAVSLSGSMVNGSSISTQLGTAYGGGGTVGADGTLTADGCDLRGTVSTGSATVILGRCSYTTGLTITDKGGNAAY